MNYVWHNGELMDATKPSVKIDNRAFHFADGFFETIRAVNGKASFLLNHFSRVLDTCAALKIDPPEDFTLGKWRNEIESLLKKNNITQGGRIRVSFFRKSSGYYLPHSHELDYIIEAYPFEDNFYKINENGKNVDVYPDIKKDINRLSMFKTLNCNIYIMASLFANERGLDDALIKNMNEGIIEATASNLFLVSNGVLYTSSLVEGCVAGTMRMNIINIALENGIKVYECALNPQNLLVADEIFLTNAIRGVEWVSSYRTKRYFNDMAKSMVNMLNKFHSENE
jgi:branched-subunit amino acid aminotransferase/4-amino-4-deoxychorismate lyase